MAEIVDIMTQQKKGIFLPIFLVLLMLGSPVATAAAAPSGATDDSQQALSGSQIELLNVGDIDESDVFELTDSVSVWDRAVIPFRSDRSDAAERIGAPAMTLEQGGDVTDANVNEFAVYDTGDITFTFDESAASSNRLDGETADIFAVRLEEDVAEDDVDDIDSIPNSISELRDLFNKDDFNNNASIENIGTEDINSGEFEITHDFDKPGMYMVFASVTNDDGDAGIEIDGNNFDGIDGEITIIGGEALAVQSDSSEITLNDNSVEPGDDISFTLDAGFAASEYNHALVVYNENDLESSEFTVIAPDDIDMDTRADEFTIEHDIETVRGTGDLRDEIRVFDRQITEERTESGDFLLADLVEFVFDEADQSPPATDATDDNILDASAVGLMDESQTVDVTIETDEEWKEGDYNAVYVATGSSSDQFATDVLNFAIEEDDPAPGPSPSPSPSPTPSLPELTPDNPSTDTEVTEANASSVAVRVTSGTSANVRFTETDEDRTSGVSFTDLNFTATQDVDFDVTSTRSRTAPSGTPDVTTSVGAFSYLQLDYADEVGQSVSDVQFRFSVSQERLERNDVDPEDVVLLRQEGDDWNTLNPKLRGERGDRYRYIVDSPGLSVYAVTAQDDVDASVTDASLSADEIEVGESVDVDATIENEGGAGEFTAELEVDGDVVAEETVELDAGETKTVSFTETFDEVGSFDVSVNGVTAGTLSVTDPAADPTDTETEPPVTTEAPEDDGIGGFAWIILVLLLIAFAAGGAYYYQQQQQQQDEDVEVLDSDYNQ